MTLSKQAILYFLTLGGGSLVHSAPTEKIARDPQVGIGASGGVGAGGSAGVNAGNAGLAFPIVPGNIPSVPGVGNQLNGISRSVGAAIVGATSVPGQAGSALGALSPPSLPGAPPLPNVPGTIGGAVAGLPLPASPQVPAVSVTGLAPTALPALPQLGGLPPVAPPPLNGVPGSGGSGGLPVTGLPPVQVPSGLAAAPALPSLPQAPSGLAAAPALPSPPQVPSGLVAVPALPSTPQLPSGIPSTPQVPSGVEDALGSIGGIPSQIQGTAAGLTSSSPAAPAVEVPSIPLPNVVGLGPALNQAFGSIFGAGVNLITAALTPASDLPSAPSVPPLPGTPPLPAAPPVPDVGDVQALLSPAALLGLASQIFGNFFQYLSGVLDTPLAAIPAISDVPIPAPAVPSTVASSVPSLPSSAPANTSLPAPPALPKMRFMRRQLPDLSSIANALPFKGLSLSSLNGLPIGGSISLPSLSLAGNLPSVVTNPAQSLLSGLLGSRFGTPNGLSLPVLAGLLGKAPSSDILLSTLSGLAGSIPLPGGLSALTASLPGLALKDKRDLADLLALTGKSPLPGANLPSILGSVPNVGPIIGNGLPAIGSTLARLAGSASAASNLLKGSALNNLLSTIGTTTKSVPDLPASLPGVSSLEPIIVIASPPISIALSGLAILSQALDAASSLGPLSSATGLLIRDDSALEDLVKRQAIPAGLGNLPTSDLLKTATGATGAVGGSPLTALSGLSKSLPVSVPNAAVPNAAIPNVAVPNVAIPNIASNPAAALGGLTNAVPGGIPGGLSGVSAPALPNIADPATSVKGLTAGPPVSLPLPNVGGALPAVAPALQALPLQAPSLPAANALPALAGGLLSLPLALPAVPGADKALPNLSGGLPSLPINAPSIPAIGVPSIPALGGALPGGIDTSALAGLLTNIVKNLPNAQSLTDPAKTVSGIVDTVSSLAPAVLNTIETVTPTLSALGPLAAALQLLPIADPTKFSALQSLTGLEAIKNAVSGLSTDQLNLLKSLPLPAGAGANPLAVVNAVFSGVSTAVGAGIGVDQAFSALFLRSVGIAL